MSKISLPHLIRDGIIGGLSYGLAVGTIHLAAGGALGGGSSSGLASGGGGTGGGGSGTC